MTGSLCTLWIRLLGSEPNLQLFTEGGRVSKEACLYCVMGLLAAGKLSPQPRSARHCINTGKRQGSYGKKLYGEAGERLQLGSCCSVLCSVASGLDVSSKSFSDL